MAMSLTRSQNYIWNTYYEADCLGEGAFGKVYRGINKKLGNKVAVKVFKNIAYYTSREADVLQTLKHEYIVQLIAIEYEEHSKKPAIIMELCNGGSLMQFLCQPENTCGLEDDEFLLVFEHLSGGLEYLKRHNVIHRDVKPDNIMRHIHQDGRVIYKLADFGTARELREGEDFASLHGTAPYLNPQMFRAYAGSDAERKFDSNVDLWSIGVTLYQTATGSLPFSARNRDLMVKIFDDITRNEGIISGVEQAHLNNVKYSKELPPTSKLSLGLKQLITPILAGLFTLNTKKRWTFIQYYEQVLDLLARHSINVFYVNKMQILKVYIKAEETFSDFKASIARQVLVSERNQAFLFKKRILVTQFDDLHSADLEFVYLFDQSSKDVAPTIHTQVVPTDELNLVQTFLSVPNYDLDRAHRTCRNMYLLKNEMDYHYAVYKLCDNFFKSFSECCKEERVEFLKMYDLLKEKCISIESIAGILEKLEKSSQMNDLKISKEIKTKSKSFTDTASKYFEQLSKVQTDLKYEQPHETHLQIVRTELSDLKGLLKLLHYSKAVNREFFQYETQKFVHGVEAILKILEEKMKPNFETYVTAVKSWYGKEFLKQFYTLVSFKKFMTICNDDLNRIEKEIHARCNECVSCIVGTGKLKKLLPILNQYKTNNIDLPEILKENERLTQQMNLLTVNLNCDVPNFDKFSTES